MNNINAYHSSNDTNALHEPRTDSEDINPHLEKRVKKIGMEANYSFNETTSTQSVSSSNLGHRSHDTNAQHEMRTDFGDIQLPIEKNINYYGISINSLPIKKRLIVLTQDENNPFNETASSQPITTNYSISIPINPANNVVNISLFKDSQKSSYQTALDSDNNPKPINNAGEKNPVLFLNKNNKVIAPHNRTCSTIDKLIITKETPMICSVAETKGYSKTDSLGAEGVDYAKQPIKRLSPLTAKEKRATKAIFQREYNKQQRETLKKLEEKIGGNKKCEFNKDFTYDNNLSLSDIETFVNLNRVGNKEGKLSNKKIAEAIMYVRDKKKRLHRGIPISISNHAFSPEEWDEFITLRRKLLLSISNRRYIVKTTQYHSYIKNILRNTSENPTEKTVSTDSALINPRDTRKTHGKIYQPTTTATATATATATSATTSVLADKADDLSFIKDEPLSDDLLGLKHRIDNMAPLLPVKKEFIGVDPKKKTRTHFTDMAPTTCDRKTRKKINKSILLYKELDNEQREEYLNERMFAKTNNGSIFPELKDQKEVVAKRDITSMEILGHYAGKQFNEDTYNNSENCMGATLIDIDRFSLALTPNKFISGFRSGNITTLINSCTAYNKDEKNRNSPERNVSFLRHQNQQGEYIAFIIALKDIKAGDQLWLDYGERYWSNMREAIVISGSENNIE